MTEREAMQRMQALARRLYRERKAKASVAPLLEDYPDLESWEEAYAGWRRRTGLQQARTLRASLIETDSQDNDKET